jgi:hypothetical protein
MTPRILIFFGLGTRKVLSRSQAVIFWGDRFGGRLVQSGTSDQLVYQPPLTTKGAEKKYDVIRLNKDDPLPEMGTLTHGSSVTCVQCTFSNIRTPLA